MQFVLNRQPGVTMLQPWSLWIRQSVQLCSRHDIPTMVSFLSVRYEWQSGTLHGVLLLWSIHFKIWLVVWFKMPSCTSQWCRAVTCIFVGHLSAWTNLVIPLWPLRATRLFCPQTCHQLEAFFGLFAPIFFPTEPDARCSGWTSWNSDCVYIGISACGIKHHTTFNTAHSTI